MELVRVEVQGFKSVKEEVSLVVDPRVTVFIGANDHGKSNLLEVVLRLNDDRAITDEDRHWDLPPESKSTIMWTFKCDDETITKIQEVADRQPEPEPEEELEEITPDVATSTLAGVGVAPVTSVEEEVKEEEPESEVELEPEETTASNEGKLLILYRDGINSPIRVLSAPYPIPLSKVDEVIRLRPRVELFEPPKIELKDETTLKELTESKDFEFMQGIFRLAGIWDKRNEIFVANDQNSRALDEASERLTKVLNSTWNQGKDLKWHLKHLGTNKIAIKIEDPAVQGRYTRPSLKSSGFRTYFLLSMITLARSQSHPSNSYIYLFDEPGTNLHPRAQIDLQRSFEELSDSTQILYTTHSLFLINKNYPDRNMVVVKTVDGTKINLKPFQKNWKAVRESLGILLSNNFLIAEKTVLVEGPSDVIYLLNAIKALKATNKIDIDLNDLSIVDAGDSSNYVALAKLMLEEGRNVLAILDGDSSGNSAKTRLEKVCGEELGSKTLQILQLSDGKSIEDVLTSPQLLQQAASNIINELVSNGIRTLKSGVDVATEIQNVKSTKAKTLGLILDETTKAMFEPTEKLSKLSIALNYEDQVESNKINRDGVKLVTDIAKLLSLRTEKAYAKGVFEEVS
ncbi:MAG TPA: AAA family ATPase [Candidatus Saccharibacteria bacterium]|nr:AAA family ATPase [Candidatus Saccharibacteria bacterium]HRQ06810.1 AAA family ATPase [Candidatus Saccharibacteria bacterium]